MPVMYIIISTTVVKLQQVIVIRWVMKTDIWSWLFWLSSGMLYGYVEHSTIFSLLLKLQHAQYECFLQTSVVRGGGGGVFLHEVASEKHKATQSHRNSHETVR